MAALPRIQRVEWTVFPPEQIARLAVLRVTSSTNISGGLPVAHSSCDLRLGTTDRRLPCATCNRSMQDCGGHCGVIQLAHPVYHCGFLTQVLKLLRVVCYYCSDLIVPEDSISLLESAGRWDRKRCLLIATEAVRPGSTRCPSCNGLNPIYTRSGLSIKADFSAVVFKNDDEARFCQRPFSAADARVILQNVSDAHYVLLGFRPQRSRPDSFVLLNMMVPPLLIRPSTALAAGSRVRGVDDLTVKLGEIVKANQQAKMTLAREGQTLLEKGLSPASQQAIAELTFHVNAFFSNEGRSSQQTSFQRSGLPFRSMMARLKGKDGRIRGTMVGKRVNFSARTVVSPDPNIDADEIGVPICMSQILTVPEVVTVLNLPRMKQRVRVGPGSIEGAVSVRKHGSHQDELLLLAYADCIQVASELQAGDIVERPLRDGDIVLFNRQPSLHKGSILGQRVRLMPHLTFGVNLISSPSTNMDCDGDEMNLHVLQSPEAQLEARILMLLPYQIVSPQGNKPCMGLVQDGILGLYLLSDPTCVLAPHIFHDLVGVLRYLPEAASSYCCGLEVSGREALNLLFPSNLNYERKNLQGQRVLINSGKLLEGRLDKSVLGTSSNSLTHHLWLLFGPTICMRFLSEGQRMACLYLQHVGFSISLADCRLQTSDTEEVHAIIERAEKEAAALTQRSDMLEADREKAISLVANTILTDVGHLVASKLPAENMLARTVGCGSKGNLINVAQIMGCVGQQVLEGQRIRGVHGGKPLLPLPPNSTLLETHGFVSHSYVQGLSEAEFFFHAMAGREGLIDTSVKTANTGYLQRRLMRALETAQVHDDGSVRNARGDLIQPCYGADGFDPAFLVKIPLHCLRCDVFPDVLENKAPDCGSLQEQQDLAQALRTVLQLRSYRWSAEISDDILTPLHIDQALGCLSSDLGPAEHHLSGLVRLLEKVHSVVLGQGLILELQIRWLLREHRPVPLLQNRPVCALLSSQKQWEQFEQTLMKQLQQARICAGEMVGAIAAQSIGSDATQMTLNVFHHAGVASKDVTLGIHRLKELTDCVKQPRQPMMTLPLKTYGISSIQAGLCLNALLTQEPQISYDLRSLDAAVQEAFALELLWQENVTVQSWVILLKLEPQEMLKNGHLPATLAEKVVAARPGGQNLIVAYSQPELPQWFLVVSTEAAPQLSVDPYVLSNLCRHLSLQGNNRIRRLHFCEEPICYWKNGTLMVQKNAPFLITEGSALQAALQDPCCLREHVRCNDVMETYHVLGIEAAFTVLFEELLRCIQFDGNYIYAGHVLLLAERMTCLGHLLPISRHGLNRLTDSGVLARCSFEETCDQLFEAAAYAEKDDLLDVTAKVCMGQLSRIGSSYKGSSRWMNEAKAHLDQQEDLETLPVFDTFDKPVVSEYVPDAPPLPPVWKLGEKSEGDISLPSVHYSEPTAAKEGNFPDHQPSAGAQVWGTLSSNPMHMNSGGNPNDDSLAYVPSSPKMCTRV